MLARGCTRHNRRKLTFKDVRASKSQRRHCRRSSNSCGSRRSFRSSACRIPKGRYLLIVAPGTGKDAVGTRDCGPRANVPFFSISGFDFRGNVCRRRRGRAWRDLFEQGKKNAPCIVIHRMKSTRSAGIAARVLGGGHDGARTDAQPVAGGDGRIRVE